MDPRIHAALTLCVEALALDNAFGYYPSDEQKAQVEALAIRVQPTLDVLAGEPYRGKGLGCGYLPRGTWAGLMFRLRGSRSGHSLTWLSRMEVLFDTAALDADAMLAWTMQIDDKIIRDHLLLHIAADLAMEGQAARVEQDIAPRMRADMAFRADRVLLSEYARQGDVAAFLHKHKRCDKRQERHTLVDARELLIRNIALRDGIDAALGLCADKAFGERYHAAALQAYARTVSVGTMRDWIAQHADVLAGTPGLEVQLLVRAYAEGPGPGPGLEMAPDPFDALFEQVDSLDKSLRFGDCRLRDALLLDLGMAAGPGPRRLQCRRKIGNASIKRELDGA